MRILMFYHSLVSDWNHGNAHFLRGVATELLARGHQVTVFEPRDGWSARNLVENEGAAALDRFSSAYPMIRMGTHVIRYSEEALQKLLPDACMKADLVLVHEWTEPDLVARIGELRREMNFRLLFHDTHHRIVSDRRAMEKYDLRNYDGVLAFGSSIADRYREYGLADRVEVWHEAADTRVFKPLPAGAESGAEGQDLVWIGNWGDEERTRELQEFLFQPVRQLRLRGEVYGVRYPAEACRLCTEAGLRYSGWIPNHEVPGLFNRFRVTVHVPRRPYVRLLPGIPTIRVFEALACGIPLICAPWDDAEALFSPGRDFLVASDGHAMERHLRAALQDKDLAAELRAHGLKTIRARHTCAHRVDQLLAFIAVGRQEEARQ